MDSRLLRLFASTGYAFVNVRVTNKHGTSHTGSQTVSREDLHERRYSVSQLDGGMLRINLLDTVFNTESWTYHKLRRSENHKARILRRGLSFAKHMKMKTLCSKIRRRER